MNLHSILVALALAGCGSSSLQVDGPLGEPIAATVRGNVVYVQATVNATPPKPLAVDTGAPITVLDPNVFGVRPTGATATIGVGALTLHNVPTVGLSPCGMMMCSDSSLDGLLGGNVLRQFLATFNYRDQSLTLGPLMVPAAVDATGIPVAFHLEGGGVGQLTGVSGAVEFPATRVSLTVTVEGADHPFILDTGASLVVLRPTLFTQLVADGRSTTQVGALTTMGMGSGQAARVRSLVVGGAEVDGATMLSSPINLDALAQEVGHPIDGLLGGTFLREFLVSIDYPQSKVVLRRYATRDHIHDEFQRVGVMLSHASDGSFSVGYRFPGSDAATNSAIPAGFFGSPLVSIDGAPLTGLDSDGADTLLRGAVGAHKVLATGAGQSFSFRVDDVLPLP